VADAGPAGIQVSVTAPGRIGSSRLDVHCDECGAQASRYVPRGTVSVQHVCGSGWQTATDGPRAASSAG
jgi:hypothetical protein